MASRFNVFLNDVGLLSVAPDAIVVDIVYSPAAPSNEAIDRALGDGVHITRRRYQQSKVEVVIDLSIYDTADRQSVVDDIAAWAFDGGILKTSDRVGKQLHVRSENIPTVGSALRWTEQISFTFVADENPYWESVVPTTATFTSSTSVEMDGYAGNAKASAVITPTGTLTTFTLYCGNTAIKLSGLNTSNPVTIDYDSYGFLRIMTGLTSLLDKVDKITTSPLRLSSDELLLPSGKTSSVSISANVSVSCTISAKGVWL